MRRLLLTIEYIGTAYHGWQVQKNAVSVHTAVQLALEKTLGEHIEPHGCSRTDAGVHAKEYCLHFDTESTIRCDGLVFALNRFLPDDIAAKSCREVSADFHARYSCKKKIYEYRIYTGKVRSPFYEGRCWHYPYKLNVSEMQKAAEHIKGTHDFKAFCASGGKITDTVRTVTDVSVFESGDEVVVQVAADGFLYNMVRIIVGTLVYVSEGKISADDIPEVLASKSRERAGITAPAEGLYLYRVEY